MDKKLKTKWVKALRSGEYKQCTGQLRNDGRFCCLGVLAVVAGMRISKDGRSLVRGSARVDYQPFRELMSEMQKAEVVDMNDHGKGFGQIADYIEKNL